MNPKLCKRLSGGNQAPSHRHVTNRKISIGNEGELEKTSVRDATLLLSIADICNSEIRTGGLVNLWKDDLTLPNFPCLSDNNSDHKLLSPRTGSLHDFVSRSGSEMYASSKANTTAPKRLRSVSIDSPGLLSDARYHDRDVESPVTFSASYSSPSVVTPVQTSIGGSLDVGGNRRSHLRKQSQRLSAKARHEHVQNHRRAEVVQMSPASPTDKCPATPKGNTPLQGVTPKGIPIKKIMRKKFSWKNYPEVRIDPMHLETPRIADSYNTLFSPLRLPILYWQLEQFLIANREEYLRHSALNYTVQQKQYNNRLTERLLELATEHGYVFDEKEFNFVTVRDRIRCYYKSYVQSAKKRGVLMGYAARKAGLLSEDDLESGKAGLIVDP